MKITLAVVATLAVGAQAFNQPHTPNVLDISAREENEKREAFYNPHVPDHFDADKRNVAEAEEKREELILPHIRIGHAGGHQERTFTYFAESPRGGHRGPCPGRMRMMDQRRPKWNPIASLLERLGFVEPDVPKMEYNTPIFHSRPEYMREGGPADEAAGVIVVDVENPIVGVPADEEDFHFLPIFGDVASKQAEHVKALEDKEPEDDGPKDPKDPEKPKYPHHGHHHHHHHHHDDDHHHHHGDHHHGHHHHDHDHDHDHKHKDKVGSKHHHHHGHGHNGHKHHHQHAQKFNAFSSDEWENLYDRFVSGLSALPSPLGAVVVGLLVGAILKVFLALGFLAFRLRHRKCREARRARRAERKEARRQAKAAYKAAKNGSKAVEAGFADEEALPSYAEEENDPLVVRQ